MKALMLIGGKSERMGVEKHLLEVNGRAQYHHLYNLLAEMGLDVCVSCNIEQYRSLPESHYKLVDQYNAIGPIGGLVAAINHRPQEPWLVVACDLVNVTRDTIQKLLDAMDDAHDIITYQKEGIDYPETTITIYQPTSFRKVLDQVEMGLYGLQRILDDCKVKKISPEDPAELKNVNTPEDLG